MDFDRWDVAVALFPFSERDVAKGRPVAVLSTIDFNREHGMAITAMITTAAAGRLPTDHALVDFASAGLKTPSLVRWKIMTLDLRVLSRRIGMLGSADRVGLTGKLAGILPTGIGATP